MNVLIACEYSGIVREAFAKLGCNAWSCDILDSATPGQHHKVIAGMGPPSSGGGPILALLPLDR